MLLITLILFFIFPKLTFAQIKIVNYQAIGLPEWVEIKNIGSSAQIIDNWFLSDLKGHQLLLSGSIDADATRRFEHQSYWLNDDGDTINLVNDIGTTVDQLVYPTPTSPPTGGPTETPLPTETPIQPGPTETPLPISTPEPTNTPNLPPILSNIYINEFMPNPETGSEWVEIYNNNDFDLSLENWRIQDNTDKQRIIANNTIPSYSYFIFMFNNYLNNTGDSIRLLDQYNRQIGETFTYNTTKKGYSFSLQEDQTWCQTVSSMNQDNFSCYSPPTSTPNPTDTPKPTSTPKNTPTPKKTPTPKNTPTPKKTSPPTGGPKKIKTIDLSNDKPNIQTSINSVISPNQKNIISTNSSSLNNSDTEPVSMIFLALGSILLLAPLIIL